MADVVTQPLKIVEIQFAKIFRSLELRPRGPKGGSEIYAWSNGLSEVLRLIMTFSWVQLNILLVIIA